MINNSRQERLKLILGTVCALFLIGFVLVFGVITRQSYTEKERNGTLKTMAQEHTVTLVESGRTSWRYWDMAKIPILRQVCGGLSRIMTIPPGRAGPATSAPITVSWKKWLTGKRRAIC